MKKHTKRSKPFISERIVNLEHLERLIKKENIYIQFLKKEMEKEQINKEKIEGIIEELLKTNQKAVNFEIVIEKRKTIINK